MASAVRAAWLHRTAEADVEGNVSPSETAIGGSHRKKVIRRGLCWIPDSAEIAMLPGWEESQGACAEKATAEAVGLPVRYNVWYTNCVPIFRIYSV